MSLRTTGYMEKYRNSGGGGGGGGGLSAAPSGHDGPDLITKLLGKDKVSGGITKGPDGRLQYTPYEGSKGFFGSYSRGRANELNSLYAPQMLAQQAEIDQMNTQAANTIKIQSSQQVTALLAQKGLPDTPENRQWVSSTLDPVTRANILQQENMMQTALKDPNSQKAFTTGYQATQLAPAVNNAKNLALNAAPGSVATRPTVPGYDDGSPITASGALTSYQMAGGMPMKMPDGSYRMVGQSPLPTQTPGGVFTPRSAMSLNPISGTPSLNYDYSMNGFIGSDSGPKDFLRGQQSQQSPNGLDAAPDSSSEMNGIIPNYLRSIGNKMTMGAAQQAAPLIQGYQNLITGPQQNPNNPSFWPDLLKMFMGAGQ